MNFYKGNYILLLNPYDNHLVGNLKAHGESPCYAYATLEAAKEAAERIAREMAYDVIIVQIV